MAAMIAPGTKFAEVSFDRSALTDKLGMSSDGELESFVIEEEKGISTVEQLEVRRDMRSFLLFLHDGCSPAWRWLSASLPPTTNH